ncbi:glycosyltransferase family 2 protein [candidate division WOR-3 bacterium]|nr:glycosyltransferase family 2 protein [candidate division WOR-3 bacterium]
MINNRKIGVLIPAYNEEKKIGRTLEEVLKHCRNVVVIDDGSEDRTREEVKKYPVQIISHAKNKGLAEAVRTGLKYMLAEGYEYVIKVDSDSQMEVDKIPSFMKVVHSDPTIEVLSATYNADTPWMIRKDMHIYSFFLNIATKYKTTDILSEYRMYNRKAMKYIVHQSKDEGYGSPLIIIDMMREGYVTKELKGGVSYAKKFIRPFPLDGQLSLRREFVTKVFRYRALRSKIVAILSIAFFVMLLIFNVVTGPKYHSILPKKFLRK